MNKSVFSFHAISTKADGSMKDQGKFHYPNITAFLQKHHIDSSRLVLMEQVHGGNVHVVSPLVKQARGIFPCIQGVDGLITSHKDILLGVVTADCLPLLFYDTKKQFIGIAHGGYKGLLQGIIQHTLEKFRSLGSDPRDIWVGIGPAIGVCCYAVSQERIGLFRQAFPSYNGWYQRKGEKYFFDLKTLARLLLQEKGVRPENIEISTICTYDQSDTFFSYRKEREKAGRCIALIGFKIDTE